MIDPAKLRSVLPPPFAARHVEYSLLVSADDEPNPPTETLVAMALDAAEHARTITLDDICARMPEPPYYPNVWPGEHYRLLAGLVLTLNPKVVVEIGTGSGLSALTMRRFLHGSSALVTFDVVPWSQMQQSVLRDEDFRAEEIYGAVRPGIVQYVDDLSNPLMVPVYYHILTKAELIFIDAAKDSVSDQKLIENLRSITFEKEPIVVFDDIRLWNMLKVWRDLPFPKLDVTSFGHWSGTGLVAWRNQRGL